MRRTAHNRDASLQIAVIFLICIVLLIAAGILLKLFLVLSASTFDSSHQYIVEIDENKQKGEFLIFNPDKKSVIQLRVGGSVDSTFGKYLEVPVDARVSMPMVHDVTKQVSNMVFDGKVEQGMTIIDKVKLLFFVNSLKPSSFESQQINLPIDAADSEKLLPTLFLDNTIYFDNESVAVINATGESGVGSTVAHMLTTIGVNVVSVTTAETPILDTTLTASNTSTYTIERIQRLFHTHAVSTRGGTISDITLTVGKKSLSLVE